MPDASPADALARDLTAFCAAKLRDECANVVRCLDLLTGAQVWHRVNNVSNSVGVLAVHLRGNVRQWVVAGLGGPLFQEDGFDRDRPAEFAAECRPVAAVRDELVETVDAACGILARLTADDLLRRYSIQGYDVTGTHAVVHVTEHFSLHAGQIVVLTKQHTGCDLSRWDADGRRVDGG